MELSRRAWKVVYSVTLAILALLVVGSFMRRGINFSPAALFGDMIDGTAHRPFVQRVLFPFLVKHLAALAPDALRGAIDESIRNPLIQLKLIQSMRLLQVDWTQLVVAASLWWASIIGFAVCLKQLARSVYRIDARGEIFLDALSLIAVAGLPAFFRYYSYVYDLTHLFVFTACLLPLVRQRWAIYLPLFLLASLSKETSVLLILIFACTTWGRLPIARYAALLGVQVLLFGATQWFVRDVFAGNPGGAVEWHFVDHNLWMWPYELSTFVALTVVAIAVARNFLTKPRFLRWGLAATLPVLLTLTLALGYLDEYRDYYEAYAFLLLLLAPTVAEALGLEPLVALDEAPS